jgi:1-deoxy-D-xylulose-5-phosphate reductoisomerase
MKKVSILGSTGSIGISSLDVIRQHPGSFSVVGLSASSSYELLAKQANEFRPDVIALAKKEHSGKLESLLTYKPKILYENTGVAELAAHTGSNIVINAIVGAAGLLPTIAALEAGIDVALANKESLVVGGALVTELAKNKGAKIIPVDSEHNAIFQCLKGNKDRTLRRIILTASGGPLLNYPLDKFSSVTAEQALNHPTWGMGKKISIDSATMVNKGLEIMEAKWLFDIPVDMVDVVIHPQSIVHGMAEFSDGSCLSVMGPTSMSVPIVYSLYYPNDAPDPPAGVLDFNKNFSLDFLPPDLKRFPALDLARTVAKTGGTAPAAFNASNEVAVAAFLVGKIKFTDIIETIKRVLDKHNNLHKLDIQVLLEADRSARELAEKICNN